MPEVVFVLRTACEVPLSGGGNILFIPQKRSPVDHPTLNPSLGYTRTHGQFSQALSGGP